MDIPRNLSVAAAYANGAADERERTAAELARLCAEVERLRAALEEIIRRDIHHREYSNGSETFCGPCALIAKRVLGRAVLSPADKDGE